MKIFQHLLVILTIFTNLLIVQPSWADPPRLTQTPEYMEVQQAINELNQARTTQDTTEYTPEEIEKKLGQLNLQKYILETASEWGQCRNETGQTLGVYAHKVSKTNNNQQPSLYYLGNGKITDDEWSCDGVYLPTGIKISNSISEDIQSEQLTEPLALKITPGTQLIAKNNPETGAFELNIHPTKVFKNSDNIWSIPNLTIANISTQIPNAPIED